MTTRPTTCVRSAFVGGHITDTHSGHNIMVDNAQVVIEAIRMVVDAVRAEQTSLKR